METFPDSEGFLRAQRYGARCRRSCERSERWAGQFVERREIERTGAQSSKLLKETHKNNKRRLVACLPRRGLAGWDDLSPMAQWGASRGAVRASEQISALLATAASTRPLVGL